MFSIEGTWTSHYEYGRGADNEPQFSEHRITFKREGELWVGRSTPGADGSEINLNLQQHDTAFSGEWTERTSLAGHYNGREFSGLMMLLLRNDDTELNGMWLGTSSSSEEVKAGLWTLTRTT